MTFLVKQIAGFMATNNFIWKLISPLAKVGTFISAKRNSIHAQRAVLEEEAYYSNLFGSIVASQQVLHGPFKGLKYPHMQSKGSALYPKLIGSYERELHGVLNKLCDNRYSEILNVGCGEGYYATGLARIFTDAKVFAFDIEEEALELTCKMAALNNVENRVITQRYCTPEYLQHFQFTEKGLIFCDCEGHEKVLFNAANVFNLKNCDLIIETHDFIDISISGYLCELFSATHNIHSIKSIDDIEKAKTYEFAELEHFDLYTKKMFYREARPAIMEWLFFSARSGAALTD